MSLQASTTRKRFRTEIEERLKGALSEFTQQFLAGTYREDNIAERTG
jgi:hypothetical protein